MLRQRSLPLVVASLLVTACASDDVSGPGGPVTPRRDLTAVEQQTVRASNAFAFAMLRELGAEDDHRGRNLVLSPYSGTAALGMALNGAAGETRAGIQTALALDGQTVEQSNATFRSLTDYLHSADDRVTVRSANSVWTAAQFPVRASFADAVRTAFAAEARSVAFGTAATTQAINDWAREQTGGVIPKVFDAGLPAANTVAVLMNALYFKGDWATRFDAARTTPAPFRLGNGTTVDVSTMHADRVAMRLGGDPATGTQIAELPYGGGAYAMTLVLPPAGQGLDAFAAALTPARWDALLGTMRDVTHAVELPKFALKGSAVWNGPLQRLGMGTAFDPRRADFSPLSEQCPPGACAVSLVKQDVDLKVDEVGTVAAAVTSVVVVEVSMPLPFSVDRPFLFAVRERASGAILFVGRVVDPRQS